MLRLESILSVFAIAFLAAFVGCQQAKNFMPQPKTSSDALRVITYNIRHAEGDDHRCDPSRVAAVINEYAADIVLLQEVDVNTARTGNRDEPAELAKLTGLHVAFGQAIPYQGGSYGQAILSRYPIERSKVFVLPGRPTAETRIAFEAILKQGDGSFLRVISTHLDYVHDETDRLQQAQKIVELFGKDDGIPTILAGDFNSTPDSTTQQILNTAFRNTSNDSAPTHPAPSPQWKIDHVFVREPERWTIVQSSVPHMKGISDHCPLIVDLLPRKSDSLSTAAGH